MGTWNPISSLTCLFMWTISNTFKLLQHYLANSKHLSEVRCPKHKSTNLCLGFPGDKYLHVCSEVWCHYKVTLMFCRWVGFIYCNMHKTAVQCKYSWSLRSLFANLEKPGKVECYYTYTVEVTRLLDVNKSQMFTADVLIGKEFQAFNS